ncbi:MAG: ATP synthase F1 subunit delta [Clostridia bacterium]|nr:ATP synthase F1 subunit delta [Clostridia bacterium]
MSTQAIARRYAGALFEAAREKGDPLEFASALEQVSRTLDENADFRRLIYHRLFPVREKQKIMVAAFPDFNPLLMNFLNLVLYKGRERALPEIALQFRRLVDRENKVMPVELRSAVPLPEEVTAALKQRLAEITGHKIRLHNKIDPAILGGIIIRLGDRVLDASLKKKLELMALHLKKA